MSKKLTFQEIILTLQQYWNDQGCMLMQAYDNEKGAGKMCIRDRPRRYPYSRIWWGRCDG